MADCDVEVPHDLNPFGLFANAFRVMPEAGDEYLLDFCVYSAQENRAVVVARIRVSDSFLSLILVRLSEELTLLSSPATEFVVRDGVLQTQDGRVVLQGSVSE